MAGITSIIGIYKLLYNIERDNITILTLLYISRLKEIRLILQNLKLIYMYIFYINPANTMLHVTYTLVIISYSTVNNMCVM